MPSDMLYFPTTKMKIAGSSKKNWYLSTRLRGVTSQNYGTLVKRQSNKICQRNWQRIIRNSYNAEYPTFFFTVFRKRWRTCKLYKRAVIRMVSHVCVYCLQANKWYPTTVDPIWMDRQCCPDSRRSCIFCLAFVILTRCTKWQGRKNNAPGSGVFYIAVVCLAARSVVRLCTQHSVTERLALWAGKDEDRAAVD
jgi:hypothetical protein